MTGWRDLSVPVDQDLGDAEGRLDGSDGNRDELNSYRSSGSSARFARLNIVMDNHRLVAAV